MVVYIPCDVSIPLSRDPQGVALPGGQEMMLLADAFCGRKICQNVFAALATLPRPLSRLSPPHPTHRLLDGCTS